MCLCRIKVLWSFQMLSFQRTASPPWFHLLQTTKTGFSKNAIYILCWSKDGFRVEYGRWCKLKGTVQEWQQAICYFSSASEPKRHYIPHRYANTFTALYPVLWEPISSLMKELFIQTVLTQTPGIEHGPVLSQGKWVSLYCGWRW